MTAPLPALRRPRPHRAAVFGTWVLCALLLAAPRLAQAKVSDVYLEKSRNNVVLYIKGNETLQYKLSEFENPSRLLITLFGQSLAAAKDTLRVNQGQVDKVFVKQEGENVRVSVALLARAQYNIYGKDGNRTIVLSLRTDDFALDAAPGQQEAGDSVTQPGEADGGYKKTGQSTPSTGGGKKSAGAPPGFPTGNFPPADFAYRDYKGNAPPPLPGYGFDATGASGGDGGAGGAFDAFGSSVDASPLIEHIVFQDADMADVALQLSKMTGVNILVDASLAATTSTGSTSSGSTGGGASGLVTLDLKNVTLEQALDYIAKGSGVAWLKVGNTYMIMSEATRTTGFDAVTWGNIYATTTLAADVRFIPLRNANAQAIASYLANVFGGNASESETGGNPNVGFDPSRNILILRGAKKDLDKAEAIAKRLDTPSFNLNLISRVIPVPKDLVIHSDNAFRDLINVLESSAFMGYDGKIPADARVQNDTMLAYDIEYVPDAGQFVYLGPPEGFDKVKRLLDQYLSSMNTFRMYQYKLVNVPVVAFPRSTLGVALRWGLEEESELRSFEAGDERISDVFYDVDNNTIFFFGPKDDADRLKAYLDRMDTAEAKVVSVKMKLKNLQTHLIAPSTLNQFGGRSSAGTSSPGGATQTEESERAASGTAPCQHALECQLHTPYFGFPYYGVQPEVFDHTDDEPYHYFSRNPVVISFYHATNTIVIQGPQLFAHRIRDLILEMDSESMPEETEDVVRLRYILPVDAGSYLTLAMSKGFNNCPGGFGAVVDSNIKSDDSAGNNNSDNNFLQSGTIQLVYGDLNRDSFGQNCLLWVADEQKSTLMLKGPPNAVRQARAMLKNYDVASPMVKLDVKVLEVRSSDIRELGGSGTQKLGDIALTGSGASGLLTQIIDEITTSGVGALASGDGSLELKFRNSKLKARVLANPNILTTHMKQTDFDFTDAVGYQAASGGVVDVETVDLGIVLAVTPYIHDETEVTLEVNPNISTLNGFFEGQACSLVSGGSGGNATQVCLPTRRPLVSNRNLTTRVRVANNVPLIIGGLISSRDTENVNKVPFLGDLPLFGSFFRNSNRTKEDLEVVIVITPTIITGEAISSTGAEESAQ